MNYRVIITFLIGAIVLSGCDFSDGKLIVENRTSDSLAFIILNESNYYPTSDTDTISNATRIQDSALLNSIAKYNPGIESKGGIHFVSAKSSKNLWTFNTTWEYLVESSPNKTLEILFIPAEYMISGKYKWKELYQKRLFDRKSIKKEELEKSDWKVTYSE